MIEARKKFVFTLRSLMVSIMVFVFPVPGGCGKVSLLFKFPKDVVENVPLE